MLDQQTSSRSRAYMLGAEVMLLLLGGIALSLLIPLLSPLWATAGVARRRWR